MKPLRAAALACTLALMPCAQTPTTAAGPTTAPATTPADFNETLRRLSAQDYETRQQAVVALRQMLAEQTRRQVEVQELVNQLQQTLVNQLRDLTLVDDPEAAARSAGLLETQLGLTRWTLEVLKVPQSRRAELLAWGLSKEGVSLASRAFSRDDKQRARVVPELQKATHPAADWTLAQLINDPDDAALRARAIAAAWHKKPSPDLIEALWHRAIVVPALLSQHETEENSPDEHVDFPGRDEPLIYGTTTSEDAEDACLATSVLAHYQASAVATRLKELLATCHKDDELAGMPTHIYWLGDVALLAETYKVKEAIPFFATAALADRTFTNSTEISGNPAMWSNRTIALGALVALTGQDPEDYNLRKINSPEEPISRVWTVPTDKDENAAIKKFYGWWKTHYKDYGVKTKPHEPPAQPEEEAPVPAPADPNEGNMDHDGDAPVTPPPVAPVGPQVPKI